jgi:NAD-dependent deacetylase
MGAGISTESGIPDFRGPEGLWKTMDPDEFHIDRYRADRDLRVRGWEMHLNGERWGSTRELLPNRGHDAIVDLWTSDRLAGVVTQNIDGLQQKAGLPSTKVAELHGNVQESHCLSCGRVWPTSSILDRVKDGDADPHCVECGGLVKTKVVMFGEELDSSTMARAYDFLDAADAVIVAGSTVAVFPASDVVFSAAVKPIPIVIINRGETEADHLAAARIDDAIGVALPKLVAGIIHA